MVVFIYSYWFNTICTKLNTYGMLNILVYYVPKILFNNNNKYITMELVHLRCIKPSCVSDDDNYSINTTINGYTPKNKNLLENIIIF